MYQVGIYSGDKAFSDAVEKMILAKYHLRIYQYRSEEELWRESTVGKDFPDILIMDVQQSDTCIPLAKNIQEKSGHVKIIFIAGNIKEASDIFEAEPTYLLLKPLEKKRLYHAMDKAIQKLYSYEKQMLRLYLKDRRICISCNKIIYIESDKRYLMIYQENKMDRIMMKLSELMIKLPGYFVRCHQSYAVNIQKIVKFEKNKIEVENGKCIAVSRNRSEETRKAIEEYYGVGNLSKNAKENQIVLPKITEIRSKITCL